MHQYLDALIAKNQTVYLKTRMNIVSYTQISAATKNYRRFCLRKCSRTRRFLDMVLDERVTHGLRGVRELPEDLTLPHGTEYCIASILDQTDRANLLEHAPKLVKGHKLPMVTSQSSNARSHLYWLLEEKNCNNPLGEKLFLSAMVALWELFVSLLRVFQRSSFSIMKNYPLGGNKVPNDAKLEELEQDITRVHALMDRLLFSSKFLSWFLEKIVSPHLLPLIEPAVAEHHPSLPDDATADAELNDMEAYHEEDQSRVKDQPKFEDARLRKVWDWLRLSFCSTHYLNSFVQECFRRPNGTLKVKVVSTPQSDSHLKPWKEVMRKLFLTDFEIAPSNPPSTGLSAGEGSGPVRLSILETLHRQGELEKARNNGKLSSLRFLEDMPLSFLGCRHAEALLAIVILLQKRPDLDEGVNHLPVSLS